MPFLRVKLSNLADEQPSSTLINIPGFLHLLNTRFIKNISFLLFIFISLSLISCAQKIRREAYILGHEQGYNKGTIEGYQKGYEKGNRDGYTTGYEKGQLTKFEDVVEKYLYEQKSLTLNNLKYVPQINASEELNRLKSNSEKEFKRVVYDVNSEILRGVSKKLNLTEKQQRTMLEIYNKIHNKISNQYYNQYLNLYKKRKSNSKQDDLIKNENYSKAVAITEVFSSMTCSLIDMIVGFAYPENNIIGIITGPPCTIISTELLTPITEKLLEHGFIEDIISSKATIESEISNMIFEFASIRKDYFGKVVVTNEVNFFITSRAEVFASYHGIVKAGYDLGERFQIDIDYDKGKILIVIGEPKIFDPVVNFTIEKIDDGILAKIDEQALNQIQGRAIQQIKEKAMKDNILFEATRNTKIFLKTIFEPIAKIPSKPFKVEIISKEEYEKIKVKINRVRN
jgi:hypothetical protein